MTVAETMIIQGWFATRLEQHGVRIWQGDTDIPKRWDAIRSAIIGHSLDDRPFGKRSDGQTETWRQSFERASGKSLYVSESA